MLIKTLIKFYLFSLVISLSINYLNAQNIVFEIDTVESFSDLYKNIIKSESKFVCNGISFKDSIPFMGSYLHQNLIDKIDKNGILKLNFLLNPNDTLRLNGDTLPFINFDSDLFIKYSINNLNYIITGQYHDNLSIFPNIFNDGYVMSMDSNLSIEWFTFLNLYPLNVSKYIGYIDVNTNGDIFVGGQYQGVDADVILVKLNKDGQIKWKKQYYIQGTQTPYFIGTNYSDGSIMIAGGSKKSAMFLRINPLTGDTMRLDTNLIIPGANNNKLTVNYVEQRSDGKLLAKVTDFNNQKYICYLDQNFNLLSYYIINSISNKFFRVNDNKYIGYNDGIFASPIQVYSFDSIGNQLWNLTLNTPNSVNFVPDGSGGLMGAGGANGFYICRIDSVGYPAPKICINKPVIHSITAQIGPGFFQLTDSVSGGLPYNPELYHNWRFQDGQRADSANPKVFYNHLAYPTSYWAELIISDGVGCSDTMRIDCYTGQILNVPKKIAKPFKKEMKLYPNPTQGELIISFNTLHIPRKTPRMYTIQLTDVLGKVHVESTQALVEQQLKIDISHLPSGMYVATVTEHTSGAVYRARVVKSD